MRHSPFTVIYDACVLYPAPLRDLLMWLGLSGRFRARWSQSIHQEWTRNLLRQRKDLCQTQLNRTCALMDRDFPAAALSLYGIEAQHPDEFIDNIIDLDVAAVVAAAQQQRARLSRPPIDVDRYLAILLHHGLVQTVKTLSGYRCIL